MGTPPRPFAGPPVLLASLASGIAVSSWFASDFPAKRTMLAAVALLVAACAAAFRRSGGEARPARSKRASRLLFRAALGSAVLLTGILLAQAGRGECAPLSWLAGGSFLAPPTLAYARSSGLASRWDGRTARLEGWCRRDGSPAPGGTRVEVQVDGLSIGDHAVAAPGRIRLFVRISGEGSGPALPLGGCRIAALGVIRSRWSPGNPGETSREASLARDGVDLLVTVRHASLLEVLDDGERHPLHRALARLRRGLSETIARGWDSAERRGRGRLLEAFLLGGVLDLPEEIDEPFRRSGLSHIVAISGLQVVLATGLALIGLRLAGAPPGAARAGALGACLLYGALASAQPSVLRAVAATALVLAARLCGRRPRPLPVLCLAAFGLVAAHPASLGDAGLQLSFAATAGLLTTPRRPARGRSGHGGSARARRAISDLMRGGFAAWTATAPLVLHHFQRLSCFALVANLAAVPAGTAIVGLGAIFLIAGSLSLPGVALLTGPIDALLRFLIALCEMAPHSPPLRLESYPHGTSLTLATLGALCGARLALDARLRAACAALAALLTCAALFVPGEADSHPSMRVDVLDVGQGDALLVSLGNGATVLVDAGPAREGGFDAGDRNVVPFLRRRGIATLDAVVVTHPHADHLGGMAEVIRRMRPRSLWLALGDEESAASLRDELAPQPLPPIRRLDRGDRLRLSGSVVATVLLPDERARRSKDPNARSLVLRLACRRAAALLTGDLDGEGERWLAASGDVLSADLLKGAHHGSAGSSTTRFLERVGPQLVLLSAGAANPWGHPRPEAIARVKSTGAMVFRTDRDGACSLATDGRILRAGPLREAGPLVLRRAHARNPEAEALSARGRE